MAVEVLLALPPREGGLSAGSMQALLTMYASARLIQTEAFFTQYLAGAMQGVSASFFALEPAWKAVAVIYAVPALQLCHLPADLGLLCY